MTRSSQIEWATLASVARARLLDVVPELDRVDHPIVGVLVDVMALSQCRFKLALAPHSVEATVMTVPAVPAQASPSSLRDFVVTFVSDRARTTGRQGQFRIGRRIDENGFLSFVIAMLNAGVPRAAIMELADIVSASIKALVAIVHPLGVNHMRAVLDRDLPGISNDWKSLGATAVWLLATDMSRKPGRPEIIKRRRQALGLFAALSKTLMVPEITAAIDQGAPLNPILASRLGISQAALRSLRGAYNMTETFTHYFSLDFEGAVGELRAHSVALHEWPGQGKPDQPHAWAGSPWLGRGKYQLLRPDYFDPDNDETRDAVTGFRDDILRPLFAARAAALYPRPVHRIERFLQDLDFPAALRTSDERRDLLTAIRKVLIGPRGAKSIGEAVSLWHRRAASVAAMRHERRADRPGWPAICGVWTSTDRVHTIVPLTTAADLVEEGNALDHCVGSYYEPCRRGATQILSLRRGGSHAGTVEFILAGDENDLSVKIGQFRARNNRRPDAASHDALKEFLGAINRGEHTLDRKTLISHRKKMRDTWDGSWSSRSLPLDHARAVFPLYRPLLPKGTAETFDAWRAASGIDAAIDPVLARLARIEAKEERAESFW